LAAPGTGGCGAARLRTGPAVVPQTGRETEGDKAERPGAALQPVTEWR
jgi:hypothetical protein